MPTGTPLTRVQIQDLRNKARLYTTSQTRVLLLEEENTELKRRLEAAETLVEEWKRRVQETEEQLKKEKDANQKLRAMLFKGQRERTKRSHEPIPRTADSYRRPKPDHVTDTQELVLDSCPDCGQAVTFPVSSRQRFVEDIVFNPQTHVTAWTINRYWCAHCDKQVEGTIPGILPKTTIGPNTLTFVVIAKYRWNQPYAKIQDQLDICFGLDISEGEIAHLITTAARLVGRKWQTIIQAVKADRKVHCDETGWYINGHKVWAHTFTNDYAVLYEILPSRGKGVVEKALHGYTDTRITDCLPNYKNLPGSHQICWAHLTREAQENAQRDTGSKERAHLKKTLDEIYASLREATTHWHEQAATHTKRRNQRRVAKLWRQRWSDERCRLLVNRLQDFQAALFTCLEYPGIPPDNNQAEQVLRKLVIQRKISGGNRSPAHAQYHAKLMSVVETLRLEGGELLPKLQAILQQGVAMQLAER
jgi:transposase